MSHPNLVEPENPLNTNWATDVCTKLSQLSLNADSDLSVSRVTVNLTTFLRLNDYWEEERRLLPFIPTQAALTQYGLLRGVAGGLIEDVEKLVDVVLYRHRLPRKSRGGQTWGDRIKRTFDTPRVKTILSSLQYIEATINLIVKVWKYGLHRAGGCTPTEEDRQRLGRERRLIRSLIMNRMVALKYVNQRLAEEDATLLNTTRSTIDGSDSDRSSRPTVLLSRRSIHAEQLAYLDDVVDFGDDSREAIQRQDQLVHDLVERWTQVQSPDSEQQFDHETVFESDEEAATGGYGGVNSSFYRDQPLPKRDYDHAPVQRAQASSQPPREMPSFGRQRTGSGVAAQRPSLSLNTSAPLQRQTPSAPPGSAKPLPISASASFNANTGPPYSAATAKPQHPRAFSMSQAEQTPDSLPQQKLKVSRDSGYGTTGTVIEDSDDEEIRVCWQIAIGKKIYPYENSKLMDISDDDREDFERYLLSHDNAVTEIPTSTVIEAALAREKKYLFERIPARGRFCEMWRIQTALKYNPQVRELVQLSKVILKERQEASMRPPTSATVPPQTRNSIPPPPPSLSTHQPSQYPGQFPPSQQAGHSSKAVNFSDELPRKGSNEGSRPSQYQPPPQVWSQQQYQPHQQYPQPQQLQQQYSQPQQQYLQPPPSQSRQQPGPNTGMALQRTTSSPAGAGHGYGTQAAPQPMPNQNYQAQGPPRNTDHHHSSRSHRNTERRKSRPIYTSSTSDSSDDSPPPARYKANDRRISHDRRPSEDNRRHDDTSRRLKNLERDNKQAKEKEEYRARNSLMRKAAAVTSGVIAGGAGLLEMMEGAL